MFRSRSWFGGGLWKPKNPHSLEHLKYLYNVLSKNQTVNESNRSLLVETLRSIAEILIWGDQNDSSVFDFFLEKNMLSFFLRIMKQKCGSYVCVQLLQTLNILFENIRNETSLYYLLSNNHVNSIIEHKFDFSDEEVMAYYISFLKTLSLKLNKHTIHFFYNEHTNDFPLYTEAIKFFNNSESMVRIAVRTLTLNVYRVDDKSMQKFIRDKTAAPYFSNLVWFIGNHVLELDGCIRENSEHEARSRLADLVAEHLDHLHYVNDILLLQIEDLNQVLTDHLLHRLFIPLYVASLDKNFIVPRAVLFFFQERKQPPKVSSILALFLLSQVFLIIYHAPLVRMLASIIIQENEAIFTLKRSSSGTSTNTLEACSDNQVSFAIADQPGGSSSSNGGPSVVQSPSTSSLSPQQQETSNEMLSVSNNTQVLSQRPFLCAILDSLDCSENDYAALFTLCLLEALKQNKGINAELLNNLFHDTTAVLEDGQFLRVYNDSLVEKLIMIISQTVKPDSKVRVITLTLAVNLLQKIVMTENGDGESFLKDQHLALIEGAREENILLLQNYYKCDEMFLEMFEDEYLDMNAARPISIEHLLMDSNLLLPPAGSPLSGIQFDKRLPCGEVERSRRSMRVYFILRKLSLKLRKETEKYLPLTNTQTCVHIDDNLDLTNSDLLACTVITRDSVKTRRFLVIDIFQFILVEPSQKRMGWGVVKFVGFLQDIEVMGDQHDSRCLHITVKSSPTQQRNRTPILAAKFMFDDHIRCMAAKQRLVKGRQKARERKLHMIGKLLDQIRSSPSPPQNIRRMQRRAMTRGDRPLFVPISKALPGLAMVVNDPSSRNEKGRRKSREASPAVSNRLREEEIPLGSLKGNSSSSRKSSLASTSSSTGVNNSSQPPSLTNDLNGPATTSNSNTSSTQQSGGPPSSQPSKLSLPLKCSEEADAQESSTGDATSSSVCSSHHNNATHQQVLHNKSEDVSTPHLETSFISDISSEKTADISKVPASSDDHHHSPSQQGTPTHNNSSGGGGSSNSSSNNNGNVGSNNHNSISVPKVKKKGIIETV